jgi:hypothetical protein
MPLSRGWCDRRSYKHRNGERAATVTLLWFVVWLISDLIGDRESLLFAPPNVWTATLILAIALDINRPPIGGRKK